jgi:hypothetical protein
MFAMHVPPDADQGRGAEPAHVDAGGAELRLITRNGQITGRYKLASRRRRRRSTLAMTALGECTIPIIICAQRLQDLADSRLAVFP